MLADIDRYRRAFLLVLGNHYSYFFLLVILVLVLAVFFVVCVDLRTGFFAFVDAAFLADFPLYFKATCAAARRAIGTRNGEQLT